jgi:hypothetical protein
MGPMFKKWNKLERDRVVGPTGDGVHRRGVGDGDGGGGWVRGGGEGAGVSEANHLLYLPISF